MKLEELKKLCEAATPGPWIADHGVYPYEGEHQGKTSRTIYAHPSQYHTVEVVESPDDLHGECIPNEADWRFIAAARTYLPKLIDLWEAAADLGMFQNNSMNDNWMPSNDEAVYRLGAALSALESE